MDEVLDRSGGEFYVRAMPGFHSGAMNGGVLHSIECFSPEELEQGADDGGNARPHVCSKNT